MTIHISKKGLIREAKFIASPNCDAFPIQDAIDLLVIHNISLPPDQFEGDGIIECFTNQLDPNAHPYYATIAHLKVSAHVLIRRDGQLIQFVALTQRAWHAGQSEFKGRQTCNDFSIGIELEGNDTTEFAKVQYQQLTALSAAICHFYPRITRDRIVGHSDIAAGRKTDPGPCFKWEKYLASLTNFAL